VSKLVERIAQHRHCKNCDKAVPYKDEFCDSNCENDWKTKMRKKKNQLTYFYVIMVIIMIMAIVLTMSSG
jgi:predicted nucleic acid-binding Zn ribbon protein